MRRMGARNRMVAVMHHRHAISCSNTPTHVGCKHDVLVGKEEADTVIVARVSHFAQMCVNVYVYVYAHDYMYVCMTSYHAGMYGRGRHYHTGTSTVSSQLLVVSSLVEHFTSRLCLPQNMSSEKSCAKG